MFGYKGFNSAPSVGNGFAYWDHPEPGPVALSMIRPPSLRRQKLKHLLDKGDADDIKEWLERVKIAEIVKRVLRQGLRGEWVYDAVEVGSLVWHDHLSTITNCVAMRRNDKLLYQAWQDGELVGEHVSEHELDGDEIRNLMVKGCIDDDDYTSKASFEASSKFHKDLEDYDGRESKTRPAGLVRTSVMSVKRCPECRRGEKPSKSARSPRPWETFIFDAGEGFYYDCRSQPILFDKGMPMGNNFAERQACSNRHLSFANRGSPETSAV